MPVRTCIGCGKAADKAVLARLTAPDGRLVVDEKGRLPGRGAYVCRSARCIKDAYGKKGVFSRVLKKSVVLPEIGELTGSIISQRDKAE